MYLVACGADKKAKIDGRWTAADLAKDPAIKAFIEHDTKTIEAIQKAVHSAHQARAESLPPGLRPLVAARVGVQSPLRSAPSSGYRNWSAGVRAQTAGIDHCVMRP